MDSRKQLAISIVRYLKTELESQRLGEEGTEALEVAVQCLENAYVLEGVKPETNVDLLKIFESAVPMHPPAASSLYPDASAVNKEMAEKKKVEGNDFMRDGKFNEAIASYTNAIDLDPNNAIYYSNRAAAYAKLNDNKNSIMDCEKALRIDPLYSKAFGRMGLAYFNDENYEKAIAAYENALGLDPANQPYKAQLESAREKLKEKLGHGSGPPGGAPAAPNPLAGMDLNSLLSNPAVMNMAQNFMTNPQVQNMFANMMGGGGPGEGAAPAAGVNPTEPTPTPQVHAQPQGGAPPNPMAGGAGFGNFDFSTVLNATSQFAQQMQQQNPEMVENLRSQFQTGPMPDVNLNANNTNPNEEQKQEPK